MTHCFVQQQSKWFVTWYFCMVSSWTIFVFFFIFIPNIWRSLLAQLECSSKLSCMNTLSVQCFCLLAGTQHKHNMLCRPESKVACFSESSEKLNLLFCAGCQGCQNSVCCQGDMYIAWCVAFRLPAGCIPTAGTPCKQVDCRLMALLHLHFTSVSDEPPRLPTLPITSKPLISCMLHHYINPDVPTVSCDCWCDANGSVCNDRCSNVGWAHNETILTVSLSCSAVTTCTWMYFCSLFSWFHEDHHF